MDTVVLSVASLILGIMASWFFSRRYYKKSYEDQLESNKDTIKTLSNEIDKIQQMDKHRAYSTILNELRNNITQIECYLDWAKVNNKEMIDFRKCRRSPLSDIAWKLSMHIIEKKKEVFELTKKVYNYFFLINGTDIAEYSDIDKYLKEVLEVTKLFEIQNSKE